MAADSIIQWPVGLTGLNAVTTWTEGTNAQKIMNAAGEMFAMLVAFDGSELDYIEVALDAGTQADTIDLEIQGIDLTADTVSVTGMPDGTAITNGSASVSDKGGSNEVVRWTFGATGPSPSGPHWVVLKPSSAGAFSIEVPYISDWGGKFRAGAGANVELEKLHDGSDWNNNVTVGPSCLRIRKKDGTFLVTTCRGYAPFVSFDQTVNARAANGTDVQGVKFTAPFDMELDGAVVAFSSINSYMNIEAVLVDNSDTELARAICNGYQWGGAYAVEFSFGGQVSLSEGSTYRLYFKNPDEDSDSFGLLTFTITSGDEAYVGLGSGEFIYTAATDPPAEGGSGTWTDTTLEIPGIFLICEQNPNDLAGGGGGGGCPGLVGSGGLITPNF